MSKRRRLDSLSSESDESVILQYSENELCVSSPATLSEGSTCVNDESQEARDHFCFDETQETSHHFEEEIGTESNQSMEESHLDTSAFSTAGHMPFQSVYPEVHGTSCDSILDVTDPQMLDISTHCSSAVGGRIPGEALCDVLVDANDDTVVSDSDGELGSNFESEERDFAESECSKESEDSFDFQHLKDPPIYSGASISVNESMIAILTFAIRHQLCGKAIADLLQLINLHCRDDENELKPSLYSFKKYFAALKTSPKFHFFCSSCFTKLMEYRSVCPYAGCHPKVHDKSFFVELPLVPQIQNLFSNPSFYSNFNYRLKREKMFDLNIEDIYDGQLYREQIEQGFLNNSNNFSLILSSDGVPVFKSSTHSSLWPLYFCINELPYQMRVSKEYMLIGGLWYGGKPAVNLMLEPYVESLATIRRGIPVKPPGFDSEIIVKGMLLAATFDLPAKSMFLGMVQFNGRFGCQVCKSEGESVEVTTAGAKTKAGKGKSRVWVYRFSKEIELRQHAETVKFSEQVHDTRKASKNLSKDISVFGVRHPSTLFKIMYDAIRGTGADELHTIHLGVVGKLLSLWFDAKYRNEPFSIFQYLNVVDSKLKKICPPNFVHRDVRSIEYDLPHWKGSEKKVWLLYLSLPILSGIMKDRYLQHHAELVFCIHTLLGQSISPECLTACSKKLLLYVQQFEVLYGTQHMTMNVHMLQHLPYVVSNLGPLWCYSCFPFENLNGEILKMIHGTRYIETQIASCVYLISQLPHAVKSLKLEKVKKFCRETLHPSCKLKKLETIGEKMFSVGTYKKPDESSLHVKRLLETYGVTSENYLCFKKLKKENMLFDCRRYARSTKNVSYYVSFKKKESFEFGAIDVFVKIVCDCPDGSCYCSNRFLAVVEVGTVEPFALNSLVVPHIKKVSLRSRFIAVPVIDLKELLFSVSFGNESFICAPPNNLQSE